MKSIFDLHCHPALKSFLTGDNEAAKLSPWEILYPKSPVTMLRSQAALSQLFNGSVIIAIAAINPLERDIAGIEAVEYVAPVITKANKILLDKIINQVYSYYRLAEDEINHLLAYADKNKGFKLIGSVGDVETGKVNIILSLEGGHSLQDGQDIISSLVNFKNSYRFLYLTLTHITQFELCTHAYGMKLLFVTKKGFLPAGKGITASGWQVIEECLKDTGKGRILVDVKHMSIYSRLQYYNYLNAGYAGKFPVIISHAGVTGVSYKKMPVKKEWLVDGHVKTEYDQPKGHLKKTRFNPWSINLYDEDILYIVQSQGLIGLNMDQRILGADDVKEEVWSLDEVLTPELIGNFEAVKMGNALEWVGYELAGENRLVNTFKKSISFLFKKKIKMKHFRHLCNNILHIVKVAGNDAWNCICLGTDFDGLINPIDMIQNAEELQDLYALFDQYLVDFATEANLTDIQHLKTNKEAIIEGLLHLNGYNFLQKHFN